MKEQLSFWNTNGETANLPNFEAQAYTQEQKVHELYKKSGKLTALEVADRLGIHQSSARRAVTNLFHRGFLDKTNHQKVERYGKKNYYYTLKSL